MNGGIYTIRIKDSEKFYVGRTKDFKKRKANHFWLLRKNKHHCMHLQNSFNKYGFVEFIEEQQENDKEKRILLEQDWFDKYKNQNLLVNYHLKASFHDMANKPWEKTRSRIAHNKGMPSPLRGLKRNPEIGAKISAAKKGKQLNEKQLLALIENRKKIDYTKSKKHMSEETKLKISQSNSGKKRSPYPKSHGEKISSARKGMKFSEEHKLKLKIAALNRKR